MVHANHALVIPGSPILKEKKSRGLFFFIQPQTHLETSELMNSSERPRKFPEIFGNSQNLIFGHSDTWKDKNLAHVFGSEKVGRCNVSNM